MLLSQKQLIRFIIEEADNGEAAFQKVQRKEFDIVLIDYRLPGITSAVTAEQIIFCKTGIKILAISSYDEFSYVEKMLRTGVKSYILKNIEPGQLAQAIPLTMDDKAYFSPEIAIKLIEHGCGP